MKMHFYNVFRALTRLRYQRFETRLENEPWVEPPIRRYLLGLLWKKSKYLNQIYLFIYLFILVQRKQIERLNAELNIIKKKDLFYI